MINAAFLKRNWKVILNITTLLALVLLLFFSRDQLANTIDNISKINVLILLLIIPVEAINYHAQTRLYQRLFSIVGNNLSYRSLFKTSLELNFVNHVFPSGGVTGISYFGLRLRKGAEISGAKATLVQVMKLALTFLSFELLILIGVFMLASVGKVNGLLILVVAFLSTVVLLGTFVFAYIVGSKRRINASFTAVTRGLNRLIQIVRPKYPETISIDGARQTFDDFHDNYQVLKSSWRQLRGPFWYAFLTNLTEVMAIYVVYLSFGESVNFGAIIIAYAVANFAGLVSVLPGGVGIYEALMTAVLASAGIPPGVSLPVTVMYRVVNTLIQVPPGYYLYQRAIRRGEMSPRVDKHVA